MRISCCPLGVLFCACTEISITLEAGPSLVSSAPDACEDNIIARLYTLYVDILVAIPSVLAGASQIVNLIAAAVHQPVRAITGRSRIMCGFVKVPLRSATTIEQQYRNADNIDGIPSIDTAR